MDPNNNNYRNGAAAGAADEDTETLQFSLTNPDELSHQLEEANLDDEETELLFQEAMKLNAQLKDALRRQQLDEHPPAHQPHPPGRRVKSGKGRQGQYQSHNSHPLAEQFVQRHPRKPCLPPIATSSEKSKSKSDKVRKPTGSMSPPRGSSGQKRKGSAKRTTKVDNRPSWDDRFSYS